MSGRQKFLSREGAEINGGVDMFGPSIKVKGQQRRCGSCSACCDWVPVELPDGPKPSYTPCKHLGGRGGCSIYANRPEPCRYWSCRWLMDPATAELRRPDNAGYIIGPEVQTFLYGEQPALALQVWVDPARPDAYRDPALRRYLWEMCNKHNLLAIVRHSDKDGDDAILLVPPERDDPDGEWVEHVSGMNSREEMMAKLERAGRLA